MWCRTSRLANHRRDLEEARDHRREGRTLGTEGHSGRLGSIVEPPGKPDTPPLTTMHTKVTGGSIVFGPAADDFCPGNGEPATL